MKIRVLFAVLTLCLISSVSLAADQPSTPEAVSDKQAAREAHESRVLAKKLWKKVEKACHETDDFQRNKTLFAVQRRVGNTLRSMPTNHLKYRARFVYSGCQAMLLDVSSHAGTCLSNRMRKSHYTQQYDAKHWQRDSAQCDSEIEHPDLSLKNVH